MDKYKESQIIHEEETCKFYTKIDEIEAYVIYKIQDDIIDIHHTIVPQEIGGKGVAARLVKATYDWGFSKNLKPMASCSYADVWCKRHNIETVSSKDLKEGCCAC